jgi:hypothetical protein
MMNIARGRSCTQGEGGQGLLWRSSGDSGGAAAAGVVARVLQ